MSENDRREFEITSRSADAVCPVCNGDSDDSKLWVECEECRTWFHAVCANVTVEQGVEPRFVCSPCKDKRYDETVSKMAEMQKQFAAMQKQIDEMKALHAASAENNPTRKVARSIQREIDLEVDSHSDHDNVFSPKAPTAQSSQVRAGASPYVPKIPKRVPEVKFTAPPTQLGGQLPFHLQPTPGKPAFNFNRASLPNISRVEYVPTLETSTTNNGVSELVLMMKRQMLDPLPTYSGGTEEWPAFHAHYVQSTKDGSFENHDNLRRLNNCLKGEARALVQGKLMYPNLVEEIIYDLWRRWGRSASNVKAIVKKITTMPAPHPHDRAAIMNYRIEISNALSVLTSLSATKYIESPTIPDTISEQFHMEWKKKWAIYVNQRMSYRCYEATLKDLVDWVMSETDWVMLVEPETTERTKTQRAENNKRKLKLFMQNEVTNPGSPSADDPEPKTNNEKPKYKGGCCFCKGSKHQKVIECDQFKQATVKKRWECSKQNHLCFVCLNRFHRKECPTKKACGVDGCELFHHPMLHYDTPKPNKQVVNTVIDGKSRSELTVFRVMPVKIHHNGKTVCTNAFFDEGSSPTLITKGLAKKLGIEGPVEPCDLVWTDGTLRTDEESRRLQITITNIKNEEMYTLRDVRTQDDRDLDLPMPDWSVAQLQHECPHLRNIEIAQPLRRKPELLIGLEHPKIGLARAFREGPDNQPVATRIGLGWLIHGKLRDDHHERPVLRCHVIREHNQEEKLEKLVDNYFSTENFGVRGVIKSIESVEIEHARKTLKETTVKIGKQYETGLLWKPNIQTLPESRQMAMRRLACLENQMKRNPTMAAAITKKISDNIECGYARKLTATEVGKRGPRCWYLPIFTVINPHKPSKVRVVYDAAAKSNGVSLNDSLSSGPDLLKPMIGVLWRSRQGVVAVAGDTRDMFHCVRIKREDQDSQRFLWRNGNGNVEPDEYVMNVMTFGATCSPCSAQYVKNENARLYIHQYPRAVETIIENHYVDDMLDSFDSEEEALRITRNVIWIQQQAGFEVRNWITNSSYVRSQLCGNLTSEEGEFSLNMEKEQTDKILGIYWRCSDDRFIFKLSFVRVDPTIVKMTRIPTKREVLRTVMSVFDPHGFASTELVHAKILLQEIWRKEVDWDQPIPKDLFVQWCDWLRSLEKVEDISIPRCYSPRIPQATRIQLHTFVDASELAFAAVSYFRIVSANHVDVAFVASKNKVAPKKHLSVPRLELQAAVLGARLAATIAQEHSITIHEKRYWSDSQTVLSWIRSDHRRYKQFVANRVSEILDTTTMSEWKWIPSSSNVADLATKKQAETNLKSDGVWFAGPSFLRTEQSSWPQWADKSVVSGEIATMEELKVNFNREVKESVISIEASRFSKWTRITRTVGWVIRAVKQFRCYKRITSDITSSCQNIHELTSFELSTAETLLLKKIQWDSFANDIVLLKEDKKLDRNSPLAKKLSPYYDPEDGLVKVRGRIDAIPDLPVEFKRPIILDKNHPITMMIIGAYHERFHHMNHETTVNEIRQRFWINGLRRAVKTVAEKCQTCKINRAKPEVPEMSPLPYERLAIREDPFTHTGMDYFGPLGVTVGRRHEKRYGVIFTCLTTRAVYVELASSLDANACIMAVRSLMNRHGPPKSIWSDNGTNLRGAENELRKAIHELNQSQLQSDAIPNLPGQVKTAWKFITPRAPHMGGAWERMVRSVKTVLYSCLKERYPKEDVLRSFLIEAEGIVNSRPLTYLPLDPNGKEALTPNHALRMTGRVIYAPGNFDGKEATKPWKIAQQLAQEFWHRFVREYLPEITTRTKWFQDGRPIREGDLVIIVEETAPRNSWERGRIVEVHPSADGKVRTATVQTMRAVRRRPVSRLALLETESPAEE